MNLTDELGKLADLRRNGGISEGEFAEAKRKLLAQGPPQGEPATPPVPDPDAAGRTYWSSRWSAGNHIFRDSVVLSQDGILFRKRRLFGSSEEHVNFRAVASIRVKNGIFLSNVSIETSGGSQTIFINGLWKSDARRIQDSIRVN